MNGSNGQAPVSVEDAVRQIIRDPEERKAFRERWPMYDAAELTKAIDKIDDDIQKFEEAIIKSHAQKRHWAELLGECKRRDTALSTMRIRDA